MKVEKRRTEKTTQDIDVTGVTLLSREEYEEYCEMIPPVPFYWWLRSPGSDRREAAYVVSKENGRRGFVQYEHVEYKSIEHVLGIRPVLVITGHDLKSGDILKLADKEWTVLSDTLAICNDLIGMCHFNIGTNDYEFSDVEMYLETWAENNNILIKDFNKDFK